MFVMLHSIIFSMILLVSIPACAENRTVTIRGVVGWGSTDSAIDGLEPSCIFLSDSEIAREVISTCKYFDECEVTGIVDKHDQLLSIHSIRKIDIIKEPSVDIIKDAAYWALDVRDNIRNRVLCANPIQVSNIRSYFRNDELFWMYDFKMIGFECGTYTPREIGSGSVSMVKRGDRWHYYR